MQVIKHAFTLQNMCEKACQANSLHMSQFFNVQDPCSYDKPFNIIISKFKAFANNKPF